MLQQLPMLSEESKNRMKKLSQVVNIAERKKLFNLESPPEPKTLPIEFGHKSASSEIFKETNK